jgi:hypothetical protein
MIALRDPDYGNWIRFGLHVENVFNLLGTAPSAHTWALALGHTKCKRDAESSCEKLRYATLRTGVMLMFAKDLE